MQNNFLSAKIIYLISALLLATGIAAPSLTLPRSLIDDGTDLCQIENIDQAWRASNYKAALLSHFEPGSRRTRPAAWFLRWVVYRLFGNQPLAQHVLKFGMLLITVFFIYATAYRISASPVAGFLSSLFFMLTISSLEAYYRLGNTEPFLVLGMASSFYYLIKAQKTESKNYLILSCLALIIAYGGKENAMALIPFSGLVWWVFFSHSSKRLVKKYFLVNCLLGASLITSAYFFTAKNIDRGYTAAYEINFPQMLANLTGNSVMIYHTYYLLWPIACGFILFSLFQKKTFDSTIKWRGLFPACFLLFLLIQIPWGHVMWRYLLAGFLPLSLSLGLELNDIWQKVSASKYKGLKWAGKCSIIMLLLHFLMANGIGVYAGAYEYLQSEKLNAQVISYLGYNLPHNGKLFMNFNGSELNEWYEETKLHLNKFYHRSDLTIKCLYPQPTMGFSSGDYIVTWSVNGFYPEDKMGNLLPSKLREKVTIETNYRILLQKERIYWKIFQIL